MKRRKNELISGVEFWRCKRKIGKTRIQEILGSVYALQNWSQPNTLLEAANVKNLLKVADCLNVTADQLFETHSTAELEDGDRLQFQSKYNVNSDNCLCNYRIAKGLNYRQLAERMGGISHQWAHQMCRSHHASQAGIRRIAKYEKMTPEEFCKEYSAN